jgi:hypothetical protein
MLRACGGALHGMVGALKPTPPSNGRGIYVENACKLFSREPFTVQKTNFHLVHLLCRSRLSCRKIWRRWSCRRQQRAVVLGSPGDPFCDGVHQQVVTRRLMWVAGLDLVPHQPSRVRFLLGDPDRRERLQDERLPVRAVISQRLAAGSRAPEERVRTHPGKYPGAGQVAGPAQAKRIFIYT